MEQNGYVKWKVFIFIVALFTTLLGIVFNETKINRGKVEGVTISSNDIKVQLSQIQTDLVWIRRSLEDSKR